MKVDGGWGAGGGGGGLVVCVIKHKSRAGCRLIRTH